MATNVTSYDRDGKLSANNYTSNPGQGFGNDNGTLNQYFGIVAGIQTTIQTTADLNNGNSFVLGTDNLYDPNTVLGYAAQAITTQTGQYYLYNGYQPLPDGAGQASTVQLPLGAMMEQQANTLALQDLAMVPIILDGGEVLLADAGADSATYTFYRGTTYYDAAETVQNGAFDASRLAQTQASASYSPGLYLTSQEETANYYSELAGYQGRGGGPGTLQVTVPQSDFDALMQKYNIQYETPVVRPPVPGQTETLIPPAAIDEFNNMINVTHH